MNNPIDNLNKLFDSRVRLGIMSALMVNHSINFNELKEVLGITDGNLASHLKALEENKLIKVQRGLLAEKPTQLISLPKVGRSFLPCTLMHWKK